MAKLPNFLVIIRSEKLSGKGQGRGVGVRKKERFVLGKRTFRSQKSKHFVLRIIQAEAQRRLPGMKAVRFTTEMADGFYSRANRHDAGYAFSLAVSTCTGSGNQWMFGGEMLKRNIPYRSTHIPLSQYTGEGGYYHTFFSTPGKSFFLNLGASALLGYETVNEGDRLLDDGAVLQQCESFIYGGAVTLEAEGYLSDRVVLLVRLRERFVWGSASGICHFQYGIGVKYIF